MKAYQLLEKLEAWTKGAFARDARGEIVMPESSDACCWCIVGAVMHCYPDQERDEVYEKISDHLGSVWIPDWQDFHRRTHAQVLEVLKACDV